jgi:hypothetical protein
MGKFRISTLAVILSIVVIAGFFASAGTSMYALKELKVGGPVYGRIVSMKDLTADILPPPPTLSRPISKSLSSKRSPRARVRIRHAWLS